MNIEFQKIAEIWDILNIPDNVMYKFFQFCKDNGIECNLAPDKNPFNMVEGILIAFRVTIPIEQIEDFKARFINFSKENDF